VGVAETPQLTVPVHCQLNLRVRGGFNSAGSRGCLRSGPPAPLPKTTAVAAVSTQI